MQNKVFPNTGGKSLHRSLQADRAVGITDQCTFKNNQHLKTYLNHIEMLS